MSKLGNAIVASTLFAGVASTSLAKDNSVDSKSVILKKDSKDRVAKELVQAQTQTKKVSYEIIHSDGTKVTKYSDDSETITLTDDCKEEIVRDNEVKEYMKEKLDSLALSEDQRKSKKIVNVNITPKGEDDLEAKASVNFKDNLQLDLGLDGFITNDDNNNVVFMVGARALFDAVDAGVGLIFEKGEDIQKVGVTVAKGINGDGILKFSAFHLDKSTTVTFAETGMDYNATIGQLALGAEYSHKVDTKLIKEVGIGASVVETDSKDFGEIKRDVEVSSVTQDLSNNEYNWTRTTTTKKTTTVNAEIQGGRKINIGPSIVIQPTEKTTVKVQAGGEYIEHDSNYDEESSETSAFVKADVEHQISDNVLVGTGTKISKIKEYYAKLIFKISNNFDLGFRLDHRDAEEIDETRFMGTLTGHWGANSASKLDETTLARINRAKEEYRKATLGDLVPVDGTDTDNLEVFKKNTVKKVTIEKNVSENKTKKQIESGDAENPESPVPTGAAFVGQAPADPGTTYNNLIVATTNGASFEDGTTYSTTGCTINGETFNGQNHNIDQLVTDGGATHCVINYDQPTGPDFTVSQVLNSGGPANTAPTAGDTSADAGGVKNASGDVAGVVSDAETADNALTYSVESQTTHGTVVFTGSSWVFTGNFDGHIGSDSFTYKVTDPEGLSDTGIVTINNIVNF